MVIVALIDRTEDARALREAVRRAPVTLLTGPRQVGKSTLVREVLQPPPELYFDLEDPRDLARLANPTLALSGVRETVVIDEAQRLPELFPTLRVLVDEDRRPGRFVVLGSAGPDLVGLGAESLAGRVTFVELSGFRLSDFGPDRLEELWLRGGLPESFLAVTEADSNRWRDDYISTFLERDLGGLGFGFPAATMRRFWTMLAHRHGQTWNAAELARSLAVSQPTARRYLDALTDALVIRQLEPFVANLSKRQVKSPRIYLRDSGLLHRLVGVGNQHDLLGHPCVGASWEGMIIEQLAARLAGSDLTFWSTHTGAELDLRVGVEGRVIGFEIKRTDRPSTSKSMHVALGDLGLDHLVVAHAGHHRVRLAEQITAIGAAELLTSTDVVSEVLA